MNSIERPDGQFQMNFDGEPEKTEASKAPDVPEKPHNNDNDDEYDELDRLVDTRNICYYEAKLLLGETVDQPQSNVNNKQESAERSLIGPSVELGKRALYLEKVLRLSSGINSNLGFTDALLIEHPGLSEKSKQHYTPTQQQESARDKLQKAQGYFTLAYGTETMVQAGYDRETIEKDTRSAFADFRRSTSGPEHNNVRRKLYRSLKKQQKK